MADLKEILVPDIGADSATVTEILVAVGDTIEADQSLISIEGDKAAMEVPAAEGGVVQEICVKVGDAVSQGTVIVKVSAAAAAAPAPVAAAPVAEAPVAAPAAAPAAAGETKPVNLPDIGADSANVTEILVKVGDRVDADQGLISIEGDKAAMEVPAPFAGVVKAIAVQVGQAVSQGSLIVELEVAGTSAPAAAAPAATAPAAAPAAASAAAEAKEVQVPDIGSDSANVTEILVKVGDKVEKEQGLITIEGDKAAMEVPAPFAGVIKAISIAVGDSVSQGKVIAVIETVGSAPAAAPAAPAPAAAPESTAPAAPRSAPVPHHPSAGVTEKTGVPHASPSVRRIAREFGVDLTKVTGTGPKKRIVKEDVQNYVKFELSRPRSTAAAVSGSGLNVVAAPKVDFAKFGPIESVPLSRIQKISGPSLHRNWVTIPHVTQFDEADITELEAFRKAQNDDLAKQKSDVKVTPLAFIMKAAAKALAAHPKFCSSLAEDGESLMMKKYIHIGVAVDTPNGLVVPVFRDVDKKGILELSVELGEVSKKARAGKLTAADMQGSCFTISSLGGIGGTQFTPIVNAPDVAILGVSKSDMKPKWDGKQFVPRLTLPLALSYDHRVIDGADRVYRFITTLNGVLSDIRRLIM